MAFKADCRWGLQVEPLFADGKHLRKHWRGFVWGWRKGGGRELPPLLVTPGCGQVAPRPPPPPPHPSFLPLLQTRQRHPRPFCPRGDKELAGSGGGLGIRTLLGHRCTPAPPIKTFVRFNLGSFSFGLCWTFEFCHMGSILLCICLAFVPMIVSPGSQKWPQYLNPFSWIQKLIDQSSTQPLQLIREFLPKITPISPVD